MSELFLPVGTALSCIVAVVGVVSIYLKPFRESFNNIESKVENLDKKFNNLDKKIALQSLRLSNIEKEITKFNSK